MTTSRETPSREGDEPFTVADLFDSDDTMLKLVYVLCEMEAMYEETGEWPAAVTVRGWSLIPPQRGENGKPIVDDPSDIDSALAVDSLSMPVTMSDSIDSEERQCPPEVFGNK